MRHADFPPEVEIALCPAAIWDRRPSDQESPEPSKSRRPRAGAAPRNAAFFCDQHAFHLFSFW